MRVRSHRGPGVCRGRRAGAPSSATSRKKSGLTHSFPNGGDKSKDYIIETTGSGVAFIDYDNDGFLDIFVLSGDGATNRMYHNDGNGHFTDVTAELGLTSSGWAEGVCAGDYDNDGYTDLFVTYWGQNRLYRNVDGKRFRGRHGEGSPYSGPHPLQHGLRVPRLRRRRTPRPVRRQLPEVRLRRRRRSRVRTPIVSTAAWR